MARNILLSEAQKRYIIEKTEKFNQYPVIKAYNEKDGYILLNDMNLAERLLSDKADSTVKYFNDDIESVDINRVKNMYNRLYAKCVSKEKSIKNQLERLCFNTLVELFNIPDDEVMYNAELVDIIDAKHEFHIKPDTDEDYEYEDTTEINNEASETDKRRLLNIFIHGATQYINEKARKYYINELFDIDENLPHLYSKLMKMNEYILTHSVPTIDDKNHCQGGYCKVTLGNEQKMASIDIKANLFPILLYESIRGLLELIISNGLPDDINVAKNVINKADALQEEPWDMMLGMPIWNLFKGENEIDVDIVPQITYELSQFSSEDLSILFDELSKKTKKGKAIVREMISDAERKSKYESFLGDMMKKQEKALVDEEGYLTEEELEMY